ncbi:Hypothetical predicted protein [Podarcis lilfordi]|uniref:Uncharacterized protein n=1 Tax=Podarcis lilfordi TaxID=74358 RepID=A0AA35KFZ5_9SAUR|nr:Hypothetical predicted protein [Podarcis lilfordi]
MQNAGAAMLRQKCLSGDKGLSFVPMVGAWPVSRSSAINNNNILDYLLFPSHSLLLYLVPAACTEISEGCKLPAGEKMQSGGETPSFPRGRSRAEPPHGSR